MMQGPIKRLPRETLMQCGDSVLPSAWIGTEPEPAQLPDLTWLTAKEPILTPANPDSPVLVMLGSDAEAANKELIKHAAAGTRGYVLVPPEWVRNTVDSQWQSAAHILIRRTAEVPATAVHTATGARLWVGGKWSLRLDAGQTASLRQVFLRLFWHEATEETWSGAKQFVWQPARERPFDVPELAAGAPVRLVGPATRLESPGADSLMHLNGGIPPDQTPKRLWFPAGPNHHDRLAKLSRNGAEIVWSDASLPDCVVCESTGQLLLPGALNRLLVTLTSSQTADLTRVLEMKAAWKFEAGVRIGDYVGHEAQFWLPGEKDARRLEQEQAVEIPEVTAVNLRAVPETKPAALPLPQPLALSVRYRWSVVPPQLPPGNEDDPLVLRWRKLDEDWITRLKRVRDTLQNAEDHRGSLGSRFTRLLSAMLGFERTHKELIKEVTELDGQRLSTSGSDKAPALLNRLAEIEQRTGKLEGDLQAEEKQAREAEEREQQEADWKEKQSTDRARVEQIQQQLPALSEKKVSLQNELRRVDAERKDADKEKRKDFHVLESKLKGELNQVEKEIGSLGNELKSLEQDLRKSFVFRPSQPSLIREPNPKRRFVPEPAAGLSSTKVPEDSLPVIGRLRLKNKQRYLAIQNWKELEVGEKDAARLEAKLVADENAANTS